MLKKYLPDDGVAFEGECVFLLGGFDGIHSGHKKLIDRARCFSLPVGIMTIKGAKMKGFLFDMEEREEIFENLTLDTI